MASSSSASNSPCAACKFLRRKCMAGCIFAPYFPPEEPQKFANVHKIFGASNVTKLLNELPPHQREDAVNSLAYEAEARIKDPVYGCVGAISVLQRQVHRLQSELDAANADLIRYACGEMPHQIRPIHHHHHQLGGRRLSNAGVSFYQGHGLPFSSTHHHPLWSSTSTSTTDDHHNNISGDHHQIHESGGGDH
ncbi:hypothetical protein Scep_021225 [Stephania cephalantha]|uniref:LOB domain-containing protein n=1 Tax=Stephania cephalantha TaxID=152367 RepID=A0AAP0F481_9MAGN